jgi:phytoene synthase
MESEIRTSIDEKQLKAYCQSLMAKGSLSFYLASRFLPRSAREPIYFLYAWCRYADDYIDEATHLGHAELLKRVATLRQKTHSCYTDQVEEHPVFQAFSHVVKTYEIPEAYPMALLDGMEMDATGFHYKTFTDLSRYCYAVAGVVGLMCCHIFGVRSEKALVSADALGRAMQLTNIARDILDDARLDRVYIPDDWFPEGKALGPKELLNAQARPVMVELAQKLVARAEVYYQQGEKGLNDLPLAASLAVGAARWIYAEIGYKVIAQGPRAWDKRVWIPLPKKLMLAAKALLKLAATLPYRIVHPWSPARIRVVRKPDELLL